MSIPLVGQPYPDVTICIPSSEAHAKAGLTDQAVASCRRLRYSGEVQILVSESRLWWPNKMNDMVTMARGDWLVFLPADDLLHETYLLVTMHVAQYMNGGSPIVYTDYQEIGDRTQRMFAGDFRRQDAFRIQNPLCGLTALIRRQAFKDIGGFDGKQDYQDWDLWYRAHRAGMKAQHVNEALVDYRIHEGQGSRSMNHRRALDKLYNKHPELAAPTAPATTAPGRGQRA